MEHFVDETIKHKIVMSAEHNEHEIGNCGSENRAELIITILGKIVMHAEHKIGNCGSKIMLN